MDRRQDAKDTLVDIGKHYGIKTMTDIENLSGEDYRCMVIEQMLALEHHQSKVDRYALLKHLMIEVNQRVPRIGTPKQQHEMNVFDIVYHPKTTKAFSKMILVDGLPSDKIHKPSFRIDFIFATGQTPEEFLSHDVGADDLFYKYLEIAQLIKRV